CCNQNDSPGKGLAAAYQVSSDDSKTKTIGAASGRNGCGIRKGSLLPMQYDCCRDTIGAACRICRMLCRAVLSGSIYPAGSFSALTVLKDQSESISNGTTSSDANTTTSLIISFQSSLLGKSILKLR
ncbi:hypothetical protein, partial [Enterococcus faecium]|uniref:hypothetical protein n=1 Tax=Enterococcus faecium TaxID=1352 RepID=UPI001557D003